MSQPYESFEVKIKTKTLSFNARYLGLGREVFITNFYLFPSGWFEGSGDAFSYFHPEEEGQG